MPIYVMRTTALKYFGPYVSGNMYGMRNKHRCVCVCVWYVQLQYKYVTLSPKRPRGKEGIERKKTCAYDYRPLVGPDSERNTCSWYRGGPGFITLLSGGALMITYLIVYWIMEGAGQESCLLHAPPPIPAVRRGGAPSSVLGISVLLVTNWY